MRHNYSRLILQTVSHFSKSYSPNPQIRNPLKPLTFIRNLSAAAQETDKVSGIVDEISALTLLEISDLNDVLRKRLEIDQMPVLAVAVPGMTFSPAMAVAKGPVGGAAPVVEEEEKKEKTAFDVKLEGGFEASAKIKIIKEVRACTDLGLKEAKDLVEKAPTLLKKGVTKDEAEKIIEKLKAVGAKVVME